MHDNSTTRKVLDYIRAHPGTTRAKILEDLPEGTSRKTVSSVLGHLARGGAIENRGIPNRGKSGLTARWFPITIEVDFKFRKIAIDLLSELSKVHHTQREDYLARRLQELFSK